MVNSSKITSFAIVCQSLLEFAIVCHSLLKATKFGEPHPVVKCILIIVAVFLSDCLSLRVSPCPCSVALVSYSAGLGLTC